MSKFQFGIACKSQIEMEFDSAMQFGYKIIDQFLSSLRYHCIIKSACIWGDLNTAKASQKS